MSLKRTIPPNEFVEALRSGASNEELMVRYELSEEEFADLLDESTEQGLVTRSEIEARRSDHEAVPWPSPDKTGLTRQAISFPVPIHERDAPAGEGRVLDIAERGLRVGGLEVEVADTKDFVIPADELVMIEPIEFRAVCRWTSEAEYGSPEAGFEVLEVSRGSFDEVRLLVQSMATDFHRWPEAEGPRFDEEGTQSVDLAKLFTEDVTNSGSFSFSGIDHTWFGKLLQALPIPAMLIDKSFHIARANQSCGRISMKYAQIVGRPFATLIANASVAKEVQEQLQRVFKTRRPESNQAVLEIDGSRMWGRILLRSIRVGETRFILLLVEDLTVEKHQLVLKQRHEKAIMEERAALEQRVKERTAQLVEKNERLLKEIDQRTRAEEALRHSEARYRLLVANSPLGIVSCDTEGQVAEANAKALKILGSGASGEGLGNLLSNPSFVESGMADAVRKCLELGESIVGEYPYLREKDRQIYVNLHVTPIYDDNGEFSGVQAVLEDVSDHKRAEGRLLRYERLKALVEMAGGVSQHFRQSLQVVAAGVQMALLALEARNFSELKPLLKQILEGTHQASQTVSGLQRFASVRSASALWTKRRFDLSDAVKEGLEKTRLWRKSNPEYEGVEYRWDVDLATGCFLEGEEDEIIEAIVNLLKNAVEAMPRGGVIRVRTSLERGKAVLRVQDQGMGIAKKDLAKLGDPFWTTKTAHAGMGLAISFGTVRSHKGTITVTSERQKGTTFIVGFPHAATAQAAEQEQKRIKGPVLSVLLTGSDEKALRKIADEMREIGQNVLLCGSAEDCLETFRRTRVDAVVCDTALTGATGWELTKSMFQMCERDGRHKPAFVLMTGVEDSLSQDAFLAYPHVNRLIEKPVNGARLVQIINKELKDIVTHAAFSGNIHGIDILEYVQVMLFTGQRSVLEITSTEGETGLIFIDKGEIRHAICGEIEGEDAVNRCLQFRGGNFTTLPWRDPEKITVTKPGELVLMEAALRRDEEG